MTIQLTNKQQSEMRGRGHKLKAVVRIGKEGINPAALAAVDAALTTHELVKVKLLQACLVDKDEAARLLAEGTQSKLIQRIGRTSLLYRPRPEEDE